MARGKAFEINAQPNRQDMHVELLEIARDLGVTLSIGTDAHYTDEMGNVELSLAAAFKAGIPKEQILNFRPVEDLLEWVATSRDTAARK
jgi:putative hydrolase